MKIVNLDKESKNRYKAVLSKEDWKKLLLEVNYNVVGLVSFILGATLIILIFSLLFLNKLFSYFFNFFGFSSFYVSMCVVLGFILLLYFKSVKAVLKPFNFRGMMIDVVEKKILLKNKTFSFKGRDTLVFSLEKKREKNELSPKNSENEKKEKKSSGWVYYVKRKTFHKLSDEELVEQGFLDNNFEEFIISPVEIKYLEDFSLVLGKEGLLGVWRQIAKFLGVVFEGNIEFEEQILLQSIGNAVSYKDNTGLGMVEKGIFLDENEEDEKKMSEVINLLRQKVEGKSFSFAEANYGTFILFREELMGIRMSSTGFELRFWGSRPAFPSKEPVINKKFVFNQLLNIIGLAIILFFTTFLMASQTDDIVLKTFFYLIVFLGFIYIVVFDLRNSIENIRSKEFLLRIMYLLERFSVFMAGVVFIIVSGFRISLAFQLSFLFLGSFLFILIFFLALSDVHGSSCPWNLTINRFMSRLVFSFEDKVLEGEYGFCVSRTHWQTPVSKVRSLALLKTAGSSIGSGDFLLAIKIDEDYVVLPLPDLEDDKIREILSFLQEFFNTLLASYSLNNTKTTK